MKIKNNTLLALIGVISVLIISWIIIVLVIKSISLLNYYWTNFTAAVVIAALLGLWNLLNSIWNWYLNRRLNEAQLGQDRN